VKSQAREALDRANEVRMYRHQVKLKIQTGRLTVGEVLADPPDEVLTWAVVDLLRCQQYWGAVKSSRRLRKLGIFSSRKIGELTKRQRQAIADSLDR
jgi:hypothetical protein